MEATNPAIHSLPLIHERTVLGERVIDLGDVTLVASRSVPGVWHEIRDGTCDCLGFTHFGSCRHICAAKEASDLDRAEAAGVPVGESVHFTRRPWHPQPWRCFACGGTDDVAFDGQLCAVCAGLPRCIECGYRPTRRADGRCTACVSQSRSPSSMSSVGG
jgi:hypothetical protein